jgi:hypothetical protein
MKKPRCSSLSFLLGALTAMQFAAAQEASNTATATTSAETEAGVSSPATAQAQASSAAGTTAADSAAVNVARADETGDEAAESMPPDGKKDKKRRKGRNKAGDAKDKDKDGQDDDSGEAVLPWEVKPRVKVGGLIHTQFSINDAPRDNDEFATPTYDFRLTNARIFVTWEQGTLLDAQAEVELSRDRDRNPGAWAPMRDAFVRVSPDRALRLRMGQFKRPFSGLQMISLKNLKLIRRGIGDVWVSDELRYGERDVGFQAEGKIGKGLELHYAFGVFNGTGRNRRDLDPNGSKDLVGRVEGHLGKHLTVSYNFANKRFDQTYTDYQTYPTSTWMSGGDIRVEYAGLWGYAEGQYGTNYRSTNQYHTLTALAMVAYKFRISQVWNMAIEPLVKGEIVRLETEYRDRRILNGTLGANYYLGDIFRLMVQGEWIDNKGPLPGNLAEAESEKRLLVQAGMYTR